MKYQFDSIVCVLVYPLFYFFFQILSGFSNQQFLQVCVCVYVCMCVCICELCIQVIEERLLVHHKKLCIYIYGNLSLAVVISSMYAPWVTIVSWLNYLTLAVDFEVQRGIGLAFDEAYC